MSLGGGGACLKQMRIKVSNEARPRLCLVSQMPNPAAGNHSTTQARLLAERLREDGYSVTAVSSKTSRVGRLLDVVYTIARDRNRIDILLVEVYSGLSFILADVASRIGRMFGIPVVLALHGGSLPEFAQRHPVWLRRVINRGRMVVAPSGFLANAIGRATGQVIRVVPNVLTNFPDEPSGGRRTSRPKMLWMRSFHDIYNPMMAIEVLALVKEKFPDASLVMAGSDKGLEASVREYAESRGLTGSVIFPGFLSGEQKASEFSSATIYMNTNTIDNSPVSLLEAWAYGLPVVSTDVGGIPDLVTDGVNGLLVKSGDAVAMAEKISHLLESPALAESISRNARETARTSTWASVGPMWEDVFDSARREPGSAEVEQLA